MDTENSKYQNLQFQAPLMPPEPTGAEVWSPLEGYLKPAEVKGVCLWPLQASEHLVKRPKGKKECFVVAKKWLLASLQKLEMPDKGIKKFKSSFFFLETRS